MPKPGYLKYQVYLKLDKDKWKPIMKFHTLGSIAKWYEISEITAMNILHNRANTMNKIMKIERLKKEI